MTLTNNNSFKFHLGIFIILLTTILLANNFVGFKYNLETKIIVISFFYISILYLFTITNEKEIDIFHPIHLVTIIYLCIFIFTPLILINQGKGNCWGVNVMKGCIKATLILNLSYTCYIVGYNKLKIRNYTFYPHQNYSKLQEKKIVKISLLIWVVGFLLSLYYLKLTGRSLSFILTLGNSAASLDTNLGGNLLFLSNFTLVMIVPLLYLFRYSNSKTLFSVLCFLTFATMYIRGFRIFVIILIISLFIVYFKVKLKKPSFKVLSLTFIILIVFFTFLGNKRGSLRTGDYDETATEINSDAISSMMESNFEIYKPFYGLVVRYPDYYDFTLGKSMVWDALINWIPRAIWPSKPLAADQTMPVGLKRAVSAEAIDHGAMAWPNIGEFYMEFGTIGCCILFYFFGIGSKHLLKFYYSKNINYLFVYAVIFPIIFQFIIRGAFSQLVPFIIFTILPFFVLKQLGVIR